MIKILACVAFFLNKFRYIIKYYPDNSGDPENTRPYRVIAEKINVVIKSPVDKYGAWASAFEKTAEECKNRIRYWIYEI